MNPQVDRLLETARVERDPAVRARLYREYQAAYHAAPAMLALVSENHVYVVRDNGWITGATTLEPHSHGVAWGPWYSLARWTRG